MPEDKIIIIVYELNTSSITQSRNNDNGIYLQSLSMLGKKIKLANEAYLVYLCRII